MKKKKGVYLMTEPGCLKPYSGAFIHITQGITELRKHFDLAVVCDQVSSQYLVDGNFIPREQVKSSGTPKAPRVSSENKIWGAIRDLRALNHRRGQKQTLLEKIRSHNPDFIYERAAYLSFSGLNIAKTLGIPHFYEVNGIMAKDMEHHYKSLIRPILKKKEKTAYESSDLSFCIGGIGQEFGLAENTFMQVQNGIDERMLEQCNGIIKNVDAPFQACFIGHLMKHHKLELLYKAWDQSVHKHKWHFHFVGGGLFEEVLAKAPKELPFTYHGVIPHHQLGPILSSCQVGIIPHSTPEASYMKLYTYAAGKMATMIPGWPNFKRAFDENQIIFFEPNNPKALAKAMDALVEEPTKITTYGTALYEKVSQEYTWQKIFSETAATILDVIEKRENQSV